MVVFDEEDYIEYSVKSIYNFASQIVIVSGSDQFTDACINYKNELRDRSHPRYNNIPIYIPDNTKTEEIIRNFYDPDGKITYFNEGKVLTKIDLRNICIDLLNDSIEWVLIVDGDEVWKEADLNELKSKLKDTKTNIFEVGFNHFFLDFKHVLHVAVAERVYRNVKGIRYTKWHTEITFPKDSSRERLNFGFNHYGYVRDLGKLNQKIRYGFLQRKFYYSDYSKRFKDVDTEILKRERKWFCPSFLKENCSLYDFSEHAEVMRSHPYFKKHWMKILYGI
jgi:hypothetical protein